MSGGPRPVRAAWAGRGPRAAGPDAAEGAQRALGSEDVSLATQAASAVTNALVSAPGASSHLALGPKKLFTLPPPSGNAAGGA